MNIEEIKEKILSDIKYQFAIGFFVFLISGYVVFKYFLFPSPPKRKENCYNVTLVLWLPDFINKNSFLSLVRKFSDNYCVRFEIDFKNFDNLENDLILSLAENNPPDIVFSDSVFVSRTKKFLLNLEKENKNYNYIFKDDNINYGFPIAIDTLVLYYNRRIFDFLGIQPPKTLDELTSYLNSFKEDKFKDFYPLGFGSSRIKNKKEIILVLQSVLKKPIDQTIDYYFGFNQEGKIFPQSAFDDINLFANEKLGGFIGFYRDKQEFLRINPRLNYGISLNPIETFPPSSQNFVYVYYFSIPKGKKNKVSLEFLKWLIDKKYQEFIETFDFVPNLRNVHVNEEKKLFIDSAKYGSSYLEIISQEDYRNFDKILEIWEKNPNEGKKELIRSNLRL